MRRMHSATRLTTVGVSIAGVVAGMVLLVAGPAAASSSVNSGGALPASAQPAQKAKTVGAVLAGETVLRLGDTGLPVQYLQQRLGFVGMLARGSGSYDAATERSVMRFQEKFGLNITGRVNRYTLEKLLDISARGPVLPVECTTGTVICIDKTQRIIRLVTDGTTTVALDARFGSFLTETREGTFEIYDKQADDFSTLFGVPMRYSMYFSGGQAIHYSPYFDRDGYSGASAGCVNTRDLAGTEAMFAAVPLGTSVFIYS